MSGCVNVPSSVKTVNASETTEKKADKTLFTFIGTPATPQFMSFAEKYAWVKGRAACNESNLCLNTTTEVES